MDMPRRVSLFFACALTVVLLTGKQLCHPGFLAPVRHFVHHLPR